VFVKPTWLQGYLDRVLQSINTHLRLHINGQYRFRTLVESATRLIWAEEAQEERQSIYISDMKNRPVVKIFLAHPQLMAVARRLLENPNGAAQTEETPEIPQWYPSDLPRIPLRTPAVELAEINIPYLTQFHVSRGIKGSSWVAVTGSPVSPYRRESHSTLEYVVDWRDISCSVIPIETVPPMTTVAIDIENEVHPDGLGFTSSAEQQVLQIGVCETHGDDISLYIHMLGSYEAVETERNIQPGGYAVERFTYRTERDLLIGFFEHIRNISPDFMVDYNGEGYDWPFIIDRVNRCTCGPKVYAQNPLNPTIQRKTRPRTPFDYDDHADACPRLTDAQATIGRIKETRITYRKRTFNTTAHQTESNEITLTGIVHVDMLQYFKRNKKWRDYRLQSVALNLLKAGKVDMDYNDINRYQQEPTGRWYLSVYCAEDARLAYALFQHQKLGVNLVQQSHVAKVVPYEFLARGQGLRMQGNVTHFVKDNGLPFVLPTFPVYPGMDKTEKYQGATVIDPSKALIMDIVATLDFSSLYPSIMRAHNLCYSTRLPPGVTPESIGLVPNVDTWCFGPGFPHFVRAHVRRGVLPQILEYLTKERKAARSGQDERKDDDPVLWSIRDALQLGYKVQSNSIYGQTGVNPITGLLPCEDIARTVTAVGRSMIDAISRYIEATYTRKNGCPFDAKIAYGDTDSVFVKFMNPIEPIYVDGKPNYDAAMDWGIKMSRETTIALFTAPINLDFEKLFHPLLLLNKKRYAGRKYVMKRDNGWGNEHVKWIFLDSSGMENVRRDSCQLVSDTVTGILDRAVFNMDIQEAVNFTHRVLADLRYGRVPFNKLIISRGLNKLHYKVKAAHVYLKEKIARRNPALTPRFGDRVPYVIVEGPERKATMRGEDPVYAYDHGLAIDTDWYLSNQLTKPLQRLFYYILANPDVRESIRTAPVETNSQWMTRIGFASLGELPVDSEILDWPESDVADEEEVPQGKRKRADDEGAESDEAPQPKKLARAKGKRKRTALDGPEVEFEDPFEGAEKKLKMDGGFLNGPPKIDSKLSGKKLEKAMQNGAQAKLVLKGMHVAKRANPEAVKASPLFKTGFLVNYPNCKLCRKSTQHVGRAVCSACHADRPEEVREARETTRRLLESEKQRQDVCAKKCQECKTNNPLVNPDKCTILACQNLWDRKDNVRHTKRYTEELDLSW